MLFQINIGVSGNVFLLLFYSHVITSHKPSSSDLILTHLSLANTITLLTRGIPDTLSLWGLRNFLDTSGCKILMYLYRVGRGLTISTTCLLSIFQAVTISPGTSRWAGVKAKLPRWILPSFIIFWILNMLIEVNMLIVLIGPQNTGHAHTPQDLKYCFLVNTTTRANLILSTVLSLRDLFFMGLMSAASSYMVFVLHRHHRLVRHLHGPGRSPSVMPEVRAAKRVIALVTLYVLLYGRQTVMHSIILNMKKKLSLLMESHQVLSFAFATISPFLMIHSDRRMRKFWKRDSPASNVELF
ncbi:vomeronasal 1 receptor ornAnaV1R3015 [Ornithorhynchus anatinus]|uniref:Vomeronasal type-1 receptor n=1 Tax=Ornithorhynchus anatinus TaxID=9258 RepID=F6RJA5_ORNAN|nr:vomeronasal 1 receptor ornAnaV1R3015 [Ornithorhynchus anatinus]